MIFVVIALEAVASFQNARFLFLQTATEGIRAVCKLHRRLRTDVSERRLSPHTALEWVHPPNAGE
jgi:hypothetical protein